MIVNLFSGSLKVKSGINFDPKDPRKKEVLKKAVKKEPLEKQNLLVTGKS